MIFSQKNAGHKVLASITSRTKPPRAALTDCKLRFYSTYAAFFRCI